MKKNYTLVVWMNNYHETLSEQIDRIYESLMVINDVDYLAPNYLTSSSKEGADRFYISKESIEQLINLNMNKRNSDLGSRFSFFTSKDDDTSGVSVSTGIRKNTFYNTIVININNVEYSKIESAKKINDIFHKLVLINKPHYACLTENSEEIGLDSDDKPKSVCWLNYWSNSIVSNTTLNEKDILNIFVEKMAEGCSIRLQEIAIEIDEDRSFQKGIEEQILGVSSLK